MNHQDTQGNDGRAGEAVALTKADGAAGEVQQQQVPKTIIVVDDELFQLRKFHVRSLAADFYDTIEDVTDPAFENLWKVAKAVPGLGADSWDLDAAAT